MAQDGIYVAQDDRLFLLAHRAVTSFGVITMVVATSELRLKSCQGQGISSSPP